MQLKQVSRLSVFGLLLYCMSLVTSPQIQTTAFRLKRSDGVHTIQTACSMTCLASL